MNSEYTWFDSITFNLTLILQDLTVWLPGSIPGYTLEIFLEVYDLERGPTSLVRPIG